MDRRQSHDPHAGVRIAVILAGVAVAVGALWVAGAPAAAIGAGIVLAGPFAGLGLAALLSRRSRRRRQPWENFERAFWEYVYAEPGLRRGARSDE
jgi:hypothetical protein